MAGRRVPLGRIPPGQPPGQVQDRTSSPAGKLSGGNLSGGDLFASRKVARFCAVTAILRVSTDRGDVLSRGQVFNKLARRDSLARSTNFYCMAATQFGKVETSLRNIKTVLVSVIGQKCSLWQREEVRQSGMIP